MTQDSELVDGLDGDPPPPPTAPHAFGQGTRQV